MKRTLSRRWVMVALVVLALGALAGPVGAAPSGTVDVTVTPEGACITVGTAVDLGSAPFSATGSPSQVTATAPSYVLSCSQQAQDLFGRASSATGDGTGLWALGYVSGDVCDLGTDVFGAGVVIGTTPAVWLDTTLDTTLAKGFTLSQPWQPAAMMPCTGSTGDGETMTWTYTFTATLP